MTSREADASLIDALRAGRPDAFERLYAEYRAPIYNLCARILGDREEAKDVTQDVFITAFTRLPEPGEKLRLRPWLYRVATNACLNQLRTRGRSGGSGGAPVEEAPSRVDPFEQAQTVTLVEASLGELNERYRTALVLKDLQGLPPEEIAEVMEVSRPNADVLVHRARASFKAAFTRLAGEGAPAPAALGLVLLPLSLPAALQAMPPLPAGLAPMPPAPAPDISSALGPVGAGLLAKIGAALTTKAAVGAAAAAVVIGGGAVAVREAGRGPAEPVAGGATAGPAAALPSSDTGAHERRRAGHGRPWGDHGDAAHRAAHHARADRRGDHSGTGGHETTTHKGTTHQAATHGADYGGSAATHGADGGGSAATTHDSGTTTTSSGTHSTSTTTHDGGDSSDGHEGSGD